MKGVWRACAGLVLAQVNKGQTERVGLYREVVLCGKLFPEYKGWGISYLPCLPGTLGSGKGQPSLVVSPDRLCAHWHTHALGQAGPLCIRTEDAVVSKLAWLSTQHHME